MKRLSRGIRRDHSHRHGSDGRRPPVEPPAGFGSGGPPGGISRTPSRTRLFAPVCLPSSLAWNERSPLLRPPLVLVFFLLATAPASCREWRQQLSKHHTTRVAPTGLARRYPQWRRYSSKGPTCAPDERWPSPNGEFVSRAHPSPAVPLLAGQTVRGTIPHHRTSPSCLLDRQDSRPMLR